MIIMYRVDGDTDMKSYTILLAGVVVFWAMFAGTDCFGQSPSDQDALISSLSPGLQQSISALTGGSSSSTSSQSSSTSGTSDESSQSTGNQILHGRSLLRSVRDNHPGERIRGTLQNVGKKVKAARSGSPDYGSGDIVLPEDKPDFWDRVTRVFLLSLMEAFNNTIAQH